MRNILAPGNLYAIQVKSGVVRYGIVSEMNTLHILKHISSTVDKEIITDVDRLQQIDFTLAVHKSVYHDDILLLIGNVQASYRPIVDIPDVYLPTIPEFNRYQILSYDGSVRIGSKKDCKGLMPAVIFESASSISKFLLDKASLHRRFEKAYQGKYISPPEVGSPTDE